MKDGLVSLPAPQDTGSDYFHIDAARVALETGKPLRFPPFEIVHFDGLTFCLNFRADPIQNALRQGQFYEAEELAALVEHVPPGASILDVGANIGNHTVYFACRLKAARVVVVEPNPLSIAPLMANILLNGLRDVVDIQALGVGLGAEVKDGFRMKRHDRNLGATKMREGGGDMQVHPGDALFEDERFDVIKIDVEGMEMDVLAGLGQTIARCRPLMLVEVDTVNDQAFAQWCEDHDYGVLRTDRDSNQNCNYMIRPTNHSGGRAQGQSHA